VDKDPTQKSTFSFQIPPSFFSNSKVLSEAVVVIVMTVIVMARRMKETLMQVRDRLKREQAERTRKRIAELLGEAEQDSEGKEQAEEGSEVEEFLRQSRQLLEQVEEERKGTVRVSVSCYYCAVCLVVRIVVCLCSLFVVPSPRQLRRRSLRKVWRRSLFPSFIILSYPFFCIP
jgi:hypothetical protein